MVLNRWSQLFRISQASAVGEGVVPPFRIGSPQLASEQRILRGGRM